MVGRLSQLLELVICDVCHANVKPRHRQIVIRVSDGNAVFRYLNNDIDILA